LLTLTLASLRLTNVVVVDHRNEDGLT
jgi:hypothetical protein